MISYGKAATAVVGVLLIAIGVGVQFGGVPSLAVTCPPSTQGCGPQTLQAAFTYNGTGLKVTLQDKSTWTSSLVGARILVAWGDGATTSGQPGVVPGASVSHTYTAPGAFSVKDTLTAYSSTTLLSSVATKVVTVSSGTTSGGSSTGNSTGTQTCNGPGGTNLCASFQYAPFTVTATGLSAQFTDRATGTYVRLVSDNWTFGDGSSGSATMLGATVFHTYSSPGTYSVYETVVVAAQDSSGRTWSGAQTRNVTITQAGCLSGCQQQNNTSSPIVLQPWTLLLSFTGVGVLVSLALAGWSKVYPILALLAIGVLAYALAGGPL